MYITATNANVAVPSTGFFKLGVGGAVTPFLSVGISVSELASVLMNLQTTGTVTVRGAPHVPLPPPTHPHVCGPTHAFRSPQLCCVLRL